MKAREWMTRQVETCTPEADLSHASMIMWRRDCGIVPVVDDSNKLVGVVTDRDICMAVATRHIPPEQVKVRDVMSTALYTCQPDDDIATALGTMRRRQVRRLPVVGEDHTVAGVLALADVVRNAGKSDARSKDAVTDQDVVDTLRDIEKPRQGGKPLDAGRTVMSEVRPS